MKSKASQGRTMECPAVRWKRLFIDITISLATAIFVACCTYGVIPSYHQGFYCNDLSIQYTYQGNTISTSALFLFSLGVPFIVLIVVETSKHNPHGCSPLPGKGFKPCVASLIRLIIDFVLGMLFVLTIVEVMKSVIGELRPHFMDTCRPNINETLCAKGYIMNYTCNSNYSSSIVKDSYKSFPSGHATLSFYSAIFMICYLQSRIKGVVSRLTCPFLQMLCLTWAVYCSMTRITDHRHHWWDVLVGGLIGSAGSYAVVVNLCEWFEAPSTSQNAEGGAKPINRLSTRRLWSTSSEQKELESVSSKETGSNHL